LPSGSFTLADGIWNNYSKLAVVLKGPGASAPGAPAGTRTVNWALYALMPGTSLYEWQYGSLPDGTSRRLLWITLYGVSEAAAVAEPTTTALLALGLALLAFAVPRRRS
jgi:hypothetical protein